MRKSFFEFGIALLCAGLSCTIASKNKPVMDGVEKRAIKVRDSFELVLQSRGGLGLQLSYRTDREGVVEVDRVDADTARTVAPGDNLPVTYRVTGIGKGEAEIIFYEYQPWNKNFKEIIQKEVQVEVTD